METTALFSNIYGSCVLCCAFPYSSYVLTLANRCTHTEHAWALTPTPPQCKDITRTPTRLAFSCVYALMHVILVHTELSSNLKHLLPRIAISDDRNTSLSTRVRHLNDLAKVCTCARVRFFLNYVPKNPPKRNGWACLVFGLPTAGPSQTPPTSQAPLSLQQDPSLPHYTSHLHQHPGFYEPHSGTCGATMISLITNVT